MLYDQEYIEKTTQLWIFQAKSRESKCSGLRRLKNSSDFYFHLVVKCVQREDIMNNYERKSATKNSM